MLRSLFSPLLNLMKLKTNECRKKEAGGSNLAQNMICQDLLVIRHCSWLCQESWSKMNQDLRWWSIHTFASSVICWAGHSIQSINPSIQVVNDRWIGIGIGRTWRFGKVRPNHRTFRFGQPNHGRTNLLNKSLFWTYQKMLDQNF